MTTSPFILSIETDAGTYQHGAHLGTIESTARTCAEEICRKRIPRIGTRIVTVALKRDGKIVDTFDGAEWFSDIEAFVWEDA